MFKSGKEVIILYVEKAPTAINPPVPRETCPQYPVKILRPIAAKEKIKNGGSMTMNEAQMWADFNKLYGTARLHSDNLVTLRSERKALINDVFEFPVMDETVPLDFWKHATNKSDGFELIIARKGKDIYLGIFNWSDKSKEYALQDFGKQDPIHLEGRHSKILKYEGNKSFNQLCQEIKSK